MLKWIRYDTIEVRKNEFKKKISNYIDRIEKL